MRKRYGMLAVETVGAVAEVALDRPDKLNALTAGFWDDLQDLLRDAAGDSAVRALVLYGRGQCFSAGGDIAGFGELTTVPARRDYQERAFAAFRALERFPKPTFAAVHGYALGGGCELTMVTDVVVADSTARFGTPEASVGLMPGLGVVRGRANVNLHWMKYLVFTGERLDAEEARLAGLVNKVVPEGEHLGEARRLASLAAGKPAVALAVAKRVLGRGSDEGYDYALEATSLLHGTEDQHEGVLAFKERRAPQFRDR
ncbi:enoyl-CoA hydratase/isomerase family protein [Amycolatopsis sp. K13G38]|uniref:Enoyl-CoA hydratase/isomerase family protein n=1 Tax=Amycolatopsis acididurans TaxID=2724524 RepID=A0ABX1JE81_9PSEU|nr:enoyl-CoA hydratase/isomerase family protein [Amycolatopsis acididurans]NKQ58038.1 enoyl-CoA hydratase/isomerase family protein [Amycolatopsis acididurans]